MGIWRQWVLGAFFCFQILARSAFANASVVCSRLDLGDSWTLEKCGERLKVLTLKGKPEERAAAVGTLLRRGTLSSSGLEYFAGEVDRVMASSQPSLRTLARVLYDRYSSRSFEKLPATYKKEVEALSRKSGRDMSFFKKAFALPDFGTALQGFGYYLSGLKKTFGCTSVGAIKKNGEMLFARNLDFAGVGVWDAHPIVVVNLPEEGSSEIPHIAFGTEGMHYGSISGVNQAGIALAVHLNRMRDSIKMMNQSVYFVGEEVLRRAHTLEEAIRVLKNFRTGPQWTFVLSDFKTGKIASVEVSKKRFFVRSMHGDFFAQTNHVANPNALNVESAPFGIDKNSRLRQSIAESMAEDFLNRNQSGMKNFLDILGYGRDREGQLSSHSDVVKAHTIQSLGFEGRRGKGLRRVYVGFDEAPVATGRFGAFDVDSLFSRDPGSPLVMEVVVPSRVSPLSRENQVKVSRSYHLAVEDRKPMEAMDLLKSHGTIEAFLMRAITLYQMNAFHEALYEIERVPLEAPDYLRFVESEHTEQSLDFLRIVILAKLQRYDESRSAARARLGEGVESPYLKKLLQEFANLKDGKRPPKVTVNYDFFSGAIE